MIEQRNQITIVATMFADTAWLYPIFAILGLSLNRGQPLMPFFLILALIALGFITCRLVMKRVEDPAHRGPTQAVLGMLTIYLIMSFRAVDLGFDLFWGPHLFMAEFDSRLTASLISGSIAAGFLWFRGVRIAVESQPGHRLLLCFRTGIMALALTVLMEQAFDINASAMIMLIIFFTVSLCGLAFTHLPPGSFWTPIVGLTVAAVLGGGLIIGMIGTFLGGRGLIYLAVLWRYFEVAIMWLAYAIAWLLEKILPEPGGPGKQRFDLEISNLDFSKFTDREYTTPELYLTGQAIKFLLLALVIYVSYCLMRRAIQAGKRRAQSMTDGQRESIQGEVDTTADLLNLLLDLLPDWLRSSKTQTGPRFPQNKPGITEMFVLYFDLLIAARERGHYVVTSATPLERLSAIQEIFPGVPVRKITECFNAACYGNLPTERYIIDGLRSDFEAALEPN